MKNITKVNSPFKKSRLNNDGIPNHIILLAMDVLKGKGEEADLIDAIYNKTFYYPEAYYKFMEIPRRERNEIVHRFIKSCEYIMDLTKLKY